VVGGLAGYSPDPCRKTHGFWINGLDLLSNSALCDVALKRKGGREVVAMEEREEELIHQASEAIPLSEQYMREEDK